MIQHATLVPEVPDFFLVVPELLGVRGLPCENIGSCVVLGSCIVLDGGGVS
jgi:hypothetical protein